MNKVEYFRGYPRYVKIKDEKKGRGNPAFLIVEIIFPTNLQSPFGCVISEANKSTEVFR